MTDEARRQLGEAAERIDVSRSSLTQAMDDGRRPFHRSGSYQRIAVADVLAGQRDRVALWGNLRDLGCCPRGQRAGDGSSSTPPW